mgnify:CR=1 FL=1
MDNKMDIEKKTTEELQLLLDSVTKGSSSADETWDLVFAIESELRKRGALRVYTYDED